jgi:hypothetical protein
MAIAGKAATEAISDSRFDEQTINADPERDRQREHAPLTARATPAGTHTTA